MFAAAAATTTTNGGLTNASAGTGYGMHAAAGFGAGLGLGQFSSAFPPPPVGYFGGSQGANPYEVSLPRPKNAALHVYISHFIDYTQQVVRQTAPALDAGVADVAPDTSQAGEPSTSTAHARFPGAFCGPFPPLMNPHVMAALLSTQPVMAGVGRPDGTGGGGGGEVGGGGGGGGGAPDPQQAQQQLQLLNMLMRQAAAFPMFSAGFPAPPGASPAGDVMGVPMFPPMGDNAMMMAMMGASMPPHVLEAMNAMVQQQQLQQQHDQVQAPVGDKLPAAAAAAAVKAEVKVEPPVAAAPS